MNTTLQIMDHLVRLDEDERSKVLAYVNSIHHSEKAKNYRTNALRQIKRALKVQVA